MIIEGSTNRAFVDYVYGELEGGVKMQEKKSENAKWRDKYMMLYYPTATIMMNFCGYTATRGSTSQAPVGRIWRLALRNKV